MLHLGNLRHGFFHLTKRANRVPAAAPFGTRLSVANFDAPAVIENDAVQWPSEAVENFPTSKRHCSKVRELRKKCNKE
jgi:hypothetical protein